MHRCLALSLIPALLVTSGLVSSLHTHAFEGDAHPEHRHGLALHTHHGAAVRDGQTARLEPCDPASHAVSVAFISAPPPPTDGAAAESPLPAAAAPGIRRDCRARHADVRVHGPPAPSKASPRAPPLSSLA